MARTSINLQKNQFLKVFTGLAVLILPSCATILESIKVDKGVIFNASHDSTEILVNGSSKGYGKVVLDLRKKKGAKSYNEEGEIKTRKTQNLSHFIELRKEDAKSDFYVIYPYRTGKNAKIGRIMNYGVPFLINKGFIIPSHLRSSREFMFSFDVLFPVLATGIEGYFIDMVDRKKPRIKSYKKRYDWPPLKTISDSHDIKKEVFLGPVTVSLPGDDPYILEYDKKEDFEHGRGSQLSKAVKEIGGINKKADKKYKDSLNQILKKNGYNNTSEKFTLNPYNRLQLNPVIVKNRIHYFRKENYFMVEMGVKWHVLTNYGDTLFTKHINSQSGSFTNPNKNGKAYKNSRSKGERALFDALYTSLIYLLKREEVQEKLKKDEFQKETAKKWQPIPLKNPKNSDTTQSKPVGEGIKSTVTLKTKDGPASGCLVSSDGYIITNYHAIGAHNNSLKVVFNKEKSAKASIIRTNKVYDLALLKVDTTGLRPFKVDTAMARIKGGQEVFGIQTSKINEHERSVSRGIVSAKREFNKRSYIQTDIPFNKGSSGGAVVNKEGKLIGIYNRKMKGERFEGLTFAIPIGSALQHLKLSVNSED